MKNSRRTGTGMLMRLVRTSCVVTVAFAARPALAYNPWVESHVAATYGYVLGKGEAAGRSVLVAAPSKGPSDPRSRGREKKTPKPSAERAALK